MIKLLVKLLFTLILFTFSYSSAYAAIINNPRYYNSSTEIPTNYNETCADSCGNQPRECWNSQAPYVSDCGTECREGDNTPRTWTKYGFDVSTCRKDRDLTESLGQLYCTPIYVISDRTCSTGDKYNSSNPPVLNAGFCSCQVGGAYKTCCSGTTPVSANSFADDPYDPLEGGCGGNTIVRCGGSGQPACGQAACNTLATPTPTPTLSPTCPTTGGWTGQSCSPGAAPIYQPCATCNNCSVAACQQYAPNIYCYFNSGQCYNDPTVCPNKCTGSNCTPGQTRVLCDSTIRMCTL